MMTDLPKPVYVDMAKALKHVLSAHAEVIAGVANAVEKEHARRQAENHKRELNAKLEVTVKPHG